jgi:hypothetical protein
LNDANYERQESINVQRGYAGKPGAKKKPDVKPVEDNGSVNIELEKFEREGVEIAAGKEEQRKEMANADTNENTKEESVEAVDAKKKEGLAVSNTEKMELLKVLNINNTEKMELVSIEEIRHAKDVEDRRRRRLRALNINRRVVGYRDEFQMAIDEVDQTIRNLQNRR